MNKPRAQVTFILTVLLGATGACANSPTDFDAYAVPAPPPPAPYSEDVRANATSVAANATAQTAYANALAAREKARDAAAQGTVVARATDRALETRGTMVALAATSTAIILQTTAQAVSAQATAVVNHFNQQSTAEAQTRIAEATGVALSATSTAVAMQAGQERVAADWERSVVVPTRKIGIVILIALALLALAHFGLRLFDALILRVRIVRDPSGHAIVFGERDAQGRQSVVLPNRAPGPVLQLVPPTVTPLQVTVEGVDADVTQRAQLIEALSITEWHQPRVSAPRLLGEILPAQPLGSLTELPVLRLIPTDQLPPGQIADGLALEAIEADWRRMDE